jgi:hypothetical protein
LSVVGQPLTPFEMSEEQLRVVTAEGQGAAGRTLGPAEAAAGDRPQDREVASVSGVSFARPTTDAEPTRNRDSHQPVSRVSRETKFQRGGRWR